ncbi:MAG: electron transfer flavoprotein subunit beta/FixA family protein [Abditibacteriota bacterium]|nr:electron transfer flavoprotein subunit beta/FixA family protein [Abditibacteriota bacterium]MBP5092595.1 electron transfer flavoprotein subunit beta/FixA family protein [Abditibacteriota bacterium]
MKICCCIKQVPGTTEVKINPETNTLVREGVETQINPFDLYALEEAVRVKERMTAAGDPSTVTVITMGPPQAEDALREAISLGADDAVLLCDRAVAGSDTWCTSYTLACGLKKLNADLVFCGMQAIDGDTGQVGPAIAVHMDTAQAAYLAEISDINGSEMTARRLTEEGYEVVKVKLPAVVTVVKEINEPRTPSLRGKMAAKKAQITVWSAADIEADVDKVGLKGSPTQVVKIMTPPGRGGGDKFEGETEELADKLFDTLKTMEVI